jgi:hypothetical protein
VRDLHEAGRLVCCRKVNTCFKLIDELKITDCHKKMEGQKFISTIALSRYRIATHSENTRGKFQTA